MSFEDPKDLKSSAETSLEQLRREALDQIEENEENEDVHIEGVVKSLREMRGDGDIPPEEFSEFIISPETAYNEVFEFANEGLRGLFEGPSGVEGMRAAQNWAIGYFMAIGIEEDTAQKIVGAIVNNITQ